MRAGTFEETRIDLTDNDGTFMGSFRVGDNVTIDIKKVDTVVLCTYFEYDTIKGSIAQIDEDLQLLVLRTVIDTNSALIKALSYDVKYIPVPLSYIDYIALTQSTRNCSKVVKVPSLGPGEKINLLRALGKCYDSIPLKAENFSEEYHYAAKKILGNEIPVDLKVIDNYIEKFIRSVPRLQNNLEKYLSRKEEK